MAETHLQALNVERPACGYRQRSGARAPLLSEWPGDATCQRCIKSWAGPALNQADEDRELVKLTSIEVAVRGRPAYADRPAIEAELAIGEVVLFGEGVGIEFNAEITGPVPTGALSALQARALADALLEGARGLEARERRAEHVERYSAGERDDPADCTHWAWRQRLMAATRPLTATAYSVQGGCYVCGALDLPEGFELAGGDA